MNSGDHGRLTETLTDPRRSVRLLPYAAVEMLRYPTITCLSHQLECAGVWVPGNLASRTFTCHGYSGCFLSQHSVPSCKSKSHFAAKEMDTQ